MTVRRSYSCNLCGSSKELIGIYFSACELHEKNYCDTENHICRNCLKHLALIEERHAALDSVELHLGDGGE